MGRAEAHALVQELSQQAVQEKRPLKEVLLSNLRVKWQLGAATIEKLFMPLTYQGSAQTFIDRLVVDEPDARAAAAGAPRGDPTGAQTGTPAAVSDGGPPGPSAGNPTADPADRNQVADRHSTPVDHRRGHRSANGRAKN